MRRLLFSSVLALALLPTTVSAAAFFDPHLGALIARQPDAPIKIVDCNAGYNEINGGSWTEAGFLVNDRPVRSVTLRFALLGMDRRVLGERSYTFSGSYAPGVHVRLPGTYAVASAYPEGTGLCAITAVTLADGSRWTANGSDHPWNPMHEVMWGDEEK